MAQRLLSIPGFGSICSTEVAGDIGTVARFASKASLALYLGMAALDNSSGTYRGIKSPRQVSTRAKAAIMTAAARHYAQVPRSNAYYDKKRAEGKSHNQALRTLGRQLVGMIWSLFKPRRD